MGGDRTPLPELDNRNWIKKIRERGNLLENLLICVGGSLQTI